jgi:uncharacterized protein involved in exopolysaccharide biosynthesis
MEQHSGYTLRDVFYVLFKHKWIIFAFSAATLLAGTVFALAFNVTLYQATAQILVSPGREHLSDITVSATAAVPPRLSFDLEEQSARTISMLTSRYLSEQLVRDIGPHKLCREPVRWNVPVLAKQFCDPTLDEDALTDRVASQVQDNIHAERVGGAALVNVTFRHTDRALAAQVVNALGNLYLERHLGVLRDPRSEEFLLAESASLKQRLAQAENDFETFKNGNGIRASVREDQALIATELAALEAQRNELMTRTAEEASRSGRRAGAANSQLMVDMRNRLLDLQRKESALAARLGDQNPDLIALRQDIRNTELAIAQEERAHHETEVGALRASQSALQSKIADLKHRSQALDRMEPEFNRLQQRLQVDQQNYRLYQAKAEEARVSSAMDAQKVAAVRVIDPARPPMNPLGSKATLIVLLAAVFGLFGGVAIAFVLELFGDRLETPERVESILEVPVLASIPVLRFK